MDRDVISTDVLVIGGGIAGIFAAVRAKEQGVDVLLLNKGLFGRDGASTWMAGPAFQVALYPPDSPEIHAKDTIRIGRYLNDDKLVYACMTELPKIINELSNWGVKYRKQANKFIMIGRPGASYRRVPLLERAGEYGGPQYMRVLRKQVKHLGISTMDDIFAVDILSSQGSVVGALGLDIREGIPKVFRAKSVILATGGHMGCYPVTLTPEATGDGCAMAYRAGAEIADMEFNNFYAYATIWPRVSSSLEDWPALFAYELGARMYNRDGDEFRKRYNGALKNPPLAIASELRAGRGSPRGGVYLSVRHLPTNLVTDYLASLGHPKWLDKVRQIGFDLYNEAIEIAPAGITSLGGCRINERCETGLDGLYAAGETAAGKEGAYTMAGNVISLCAGTGSIAGSQAATRAANISLPELDSTQVNIILERIFGLPRKEKGYRPFQVRKKAQDILNKYAGPIGRTDKGLQEGLREIKRLKEEVLPNMYVTSASLRFNLEWVKGLEAINMADIAQLILTAALERTESRGLHYREDYPQENPEWLKRIVMRQAEGKVIINVEPVTFTHSEPQEGRLKSG